MDPFGLVVPEAMNQGCVVMCSQLVGASDYLDSDFVCDINDFEQELICITKDHLNLIRKLIRLVLSSIIRICLKII